MPPADPLVVRLHFGDVALAHLVRIRAAGRPALPGPAPIVP
jgi:hypothetical protein